LAVARPCRIDPRDHPGSSLNEQGLQSRPNDSRNDFAGSAGRERLAALVRRIVQDQRGSISRHVALDAEKKAAALISNWILEIGDPLELEVWKLELPSSSATYPTPSSLS